VIGSQRCDLFTNCTIFCSNSHLFITQWEWDSKTKQAIIFQSFFKLANHIAGKWKTKTRKFWLLNCVFKIDLIKWQLNFGSCNFGLKSYLWIQIELALRARSILKSRIWFQTKLHSTQFKYLYKKGLDVDFRVMHDGKNVHFTWKRTRFLFHATSKLKNADFSLKKVWMLISG